MAPDYDFTLTWFARVDDFGKGWWDSMDKESHEYVKKIKNFSDGTAVIFF